VAGETYCEACDHVHGDTRGLEPWKWRCIKAPSSPGYGFVSRSFAPHPPYGLCSRKNDKGECAEFAPLREPPKGDAR
jgi:hypothetical protein